MYSSIDSGGQTHVKYAHFYFPRKIEVLCSNCSRPSTLTNIDAPIEIEFFIDIAPYKHEWNFNCNHCLKRKLVDWDSVKKFELLNKINIRNETIWAWNTNHLDYLVGVFSNSENKNHEWTFYRNYIKKNWFQKIKNKSDRKKLLDLLLTNIDLFKTQP